MAEKKWYQSKTKMGVVLIGLSAILGTVGGMMTGAVSFVTGFQTLLVEVGAVWALFGLRNLPFVNRTK